MPSITIPVIFSSGGILDSIFWTVGIWVLLVLFILFISAVSALLRGELSLPRMEITGRKVAVVALIATLGVVAFWIHPLLLIPVFVIVLVALALHEVYTMQPDREVGNSGEETVIRGRSRPVTQEDTVLDAQYRVVDEAERKARQARPAMSGREATDYHKVVDDQRSQYEEQKRRELERKLLEKEMERLQYIHGLYAEDFPGYLQEAERFRREYGKNIQCDVCGRWDQALSVHRNQTYCTRCLPPGGKPGT